MNNIYIIFLLSTTFGFSQTRDMELKLNILSFLPKGGLGLAVETPFGKRQSISISVAAGNQSFSEYSKNYKYYRTLLVEYRLATGALEQKNFVLFGGPYVRYKYINWKYSDPNASWFSFGPGNLNLEARSVSGGLSAGIKTKLTKKWILETKGGLGYMHRYCINEIDSNSFIDTETIDAVVSISLGINMESKTKK